MEKFQQKEESTPNNTNSDQYIRYKIKTVQQPNRSKLPNLYIPKIKKFGLAKLLIKELLHYNFKLFKSEYRKLFLSRPCIYGVFSGRLAGFKPIVERCTGCMRCVQEYPFVATVEINRNFSNFGDSIWIPLDLIPQQSTPLHTVNYEAETSKIRVKGMGYKGKFGGAFWDGIWTDMSEIVRPTRDGVYGREFISTEVDIGFKPDRVNFGEVSESLCRSIPIPIIFDLLPENLTSQSINQSIRIAAKNLQTLYITKEDHSNNSILSIDHDLNLLKQNGSTSILQIEPNHFHNLEYEKLPKERLIVKIKFQKNFETRIVELAKQGFTIFHLYADYHGFEFESNQPRHVSELIRVAHNTLVDEKLRKNVTIIVSGGIILAEHIPKAVICGADLVAINTSVLIALQTRFKGEIRDPDNSEIEKEIFSSDWGSQRLVNLISSWHNQLIEVLSAMGQRDVRRLVGDVGRAIFQEHEEINFIKELGIDYE